MADDTDRNNAIKGLVKAAVSEWFAEENERAKKAKEQADKDGKDKTPGKSVWDFLTGTGG